MKYFVIFLILIGFSGTIYAFESEEPIHLEILIVDPKPVYYAGDSIKLTIRAVNHFFPGNVTVSLIDQSTKMTISEITVTKESEHAIAKIEIPISLSTGTYEIFTKSVIRGQEYHEQKSIQVYSSKPDPYAADESLRLASEKKYIAEESMGGGSGMGFFDSSNFQLSTVIIAIIIGGGSALGMTYYLGKRK